MLSHPLYKDLSPKDMKKKILDMAEQKAIKGVSMEDLVGDGLARDLYQVIYDYRTTKRPDLHELFRETARKMVKESYIDESLMPVIEPITKTDARSAVFDKVEELLVAKIENTLREEHIQKSTLEAFAPRASTTRLASCCPERWHLKEEIHESPSEQDEPFE